MMSPHVFEDFRHSTFPMTVQVRRAGRRGDRLPATPSRPLQTLGRATHPETLVGMRHMGGQAQVIVREPRALPMNIGHQGTVALLGHQFASSSLDGGDRSTDVFLRYVVSNHDIVPSRMDRWDAALPSASVG